ncbi:MAG TPA: S9 family peptidase [Chitinophagaceae bacterium]|jgi:dipeptidyl aminopeptidase/acylaminoacyl peptidase|nr:S9 family peptidase [Chitinophagaceae bacterium]
MKNKSLLLSCLFISAVAYSQQNSSHTFEKWLSLSNVSSVSVSPDGNAVVYGVTSVDWDMDGYDTEYWLYKQGGTPVQVTNTSKGSTTTARFTPDGKYISYLSKRQLYLLPVDGGAPIQITNEKSGVGNYQVSPDGKLIAFLKQEEETGTEKWYTEPATPGRNSHVWLLDFSIDSTKRTTSRRLTQGDYTITRYVWQPDSKGLALNCQPSTIPYAEIHSTISLVDIATGKMYQLISKPFFSAFQAWAPDGRSFIYNTNGTDSLRYFFNNKKYFIYDMATRKEREVLVAPDENKNIITWKNDGIYFSYLDKTKWELCRWQPVTNALTRFKLPVNTIGGLSIARESDKIAFTGCGYTDLNEAYIGNGNVFEKITQSSMQLKDIVVPVNEVIQWKGKDGLTVEGILMHSTNFDKSKKHPLLVVIHGGPDATDLPEAVPGRIYPINHWIEKGAVVLKVNYRGSTGYGEKWRGLSVRKIGVTDIGDILSGIDHLNKLGIIDTARMGCMGWSMGGFMSAFLGTHTNRFKAVSVGAGISDWNNYYTGTDLPSFTKQYLKSTPWDDPAIYYKASPIAAIKTARTPTLIQHGDLDERVPVMNAYTLYRGLQDHGVPARLIIFKGIGHALNKPKEKLAATWQNWNWFNKYVFGEPEENIDTGKKP